MGQKYTRLSLAGEPPDLVSSHHSEEEKALLQQAAGSSAGGAAAEEGANAFHTAANLANGLNGAGLLPLPFTVALAGAMALPIIVFVAMLSWYCACVIVACLYSKGADHQWERKRKSYHENGIDAFGAVGGRLVLAVQLVTLIAAAALFLVLIGTSLATAIPGSASSWLGNRGWTMIAWLIISPTAWLPSLRQVSWLSGAGVMVLFGLLSAVIYAAIIAIPDAGQVHGVHQSNSGGNVSGLLATRWAELPTFTKARSSLSCVFGMVLFSFSCHTMLPSLEDGMRPAERRRFPLVLGLTFGFSMLLRNTSL